MLRAIALAAAALLGCYPHTGAATQAPAPPFIPTEPGKPVPDEISQVATRWQPWGVKVTFESRHCGFDNAWYVYDKKVVVLCDDLFDRTDLARWIVNHELAHAFQWQSRLDLSKVNIEFEADELAFWLATPEEVEAAINDLLADPLTGGTTHPRNLERARMVQCLRDGVMTRGAVTELCRIYAQSSFGKWTMLRAAKAKR